ncbi:MAG: HTH-type sugar sensing transcriptional regulator TrmB [Salinirussus sp.]
MDDGLQGALADLAARFEFTEYEVKAYLTVLQHGELTASELAEYADIPQPRVYDTARNLAEDGFVELRESRPMKVLAIDPEEAFGGLQTSLDELVDRLENQYVAPARGAGGASLIKSRPTILRYIGEVVAAAEYELLLAMNGDLLERFGDEIRARHAENTAVNLLLAPESQAPRPDEYDYGAVADTVRTRRGVTTPVVAVADGSYALYATQDALEDGTEQYGIIFDRSELGFLISGFYNTVLWTTSETAFEAESGRPFPRQYTTVRRCVTELQDDDRTLYASVEGRDIETGEHRVVEGTVVSVAFGTNRETATLVVESDGEIVNVGGQLAALEDIEASEILVDTSYPPGEAED